MCDTDGMEWEFLVASPGYWQAPETDNFYRCLIATQCSGGSADANGTQCAANRVGPLCAQCANGYSESVSGACEVCEDTTGGIIGTVFVAVVAGAILYLNYFIILESTRNLIDASIAEDKRITKQQTLLKSAEKELTQKYTAEGKTPAEIKQLVKTEVQVLKKKKFVASDFTAADEDGYSRYEGQLTIHGPPSPKAEFTYKLKILLGFMQILSNVSTALEIQWPQSFIDFLQLFNPFQLDFLKYANVDCIAKDYNFFFAMYAWVLLPPVVILLLVVFYLLPGYRRFPAKTEKAHQCAKLVAGSSGVWFVLPSFSFILQFLRLFFELTCAKILRVFGICNLIFPSLATPPNGKPQLTGRAFSLFCTLSVFPPYFCTCFIRIVQSWI